MNTTDARHYANQIRLEQSDIRKELRQLPSNESHLLAIQLLEENVQAVQYMRVGHFLRAINGIGHVSAAQICRFLQANELRRIGPETPTHARGAAVPLTDRQRQVLKDVLTIRTNPEPQEPPDVAA